MKGFLSFGKGAGVVLLVLILALSLSFAAACGDDDDDDNDNDNGESSFVNAAAITVTPMTVVMLYPTQTYPTSWPGGTIEVRGSGFVPEEEVALTLVGAQLMEGETITTKDISIGLPYFASSSGVVEFLWQSTPVTLQPGAYSLVATGQAGSAASTVLTIAAEQPLPPGLAPRIEVIDISGDGKIDNYAGEGPTGPATEFFKVIGSGFTPGEIITLMLPGGYQGRDVIFTDPFPPGPDRTAPFPPPTAGADGTWETNPPVFIGGAPLDPGVYTLLAGIFQPPGVGAGTGWQGFGSMATYPIVLEEVE
jgi:hypothetical protein